MAFIKAKTIGDLVGTWVILAKDVKTLAGTFEKGTRVQITESYLHRENIHFSFHDGEGNRANDVAGDSFVIPE